MPRHFPVQLNALVTQNFTTGTTLVRQFGILEYLGDQPLYISKLYAMYRYSVVTSVSIDAQFTNHQTSGSTLFTACVMPASDVPSTNAEEISEMPRSKTELVSASSGINKARIKISANAQEVFGAPYFTRDFWINSAQSVSATPLDTQEPVIVFAVGDYIGANPLSGQIQYRLTYNCVFFDLQTAT
jgi:hypothetical protein